MGSWSAIGQASRISRTENGLMIEATQEMTARELRERAVEIVREAAGIPAGQDRVAQRETEMA
jgi:hypothetical protein